MVRNGVFSDPYAAKYQLKGASERSDISRLWKLEGSYITDSIIPPPHTHTI